jgi:hypothetical protein
MWFRECCFMRYLLPHKTTFSKPHSTALDARMLTITPPMKIPHKTTFSKPHSTALDARMLTITPPMRIPHKAKSSKPHSTALDARMLTITPPNIYICCSSAQHVAITSKNKDWLARIQNNVSEWNDISIHKQLFY